jgi:hypothetical protein
MDSPVPAPNWLVWTVIRRTPPASTCRISGRIDFYFCYRYLIGCSLAPGWNSLRTSLFFVILALCLPVQTGWWAQMRYVALNFFYIFREEKDKFAIIAKESELKSEYEVGLYLLFHSCSHNEFRKTKNICLNVDNNCRLPQSNRKIYRYSVTRTSRKLVTTMR